MSRRARNVLAGIFLATLIIFGGVMLGLGISGFINAHTLTTSGQPDFAQVTATSGYGNDAVQVTYQVNGRQVQGTVDVRPSSVYQGEIVAVVYDPGNPQVVSLASDVGDASSALAQTSVGAVALLSIPASIVMALVSRRRSRRRAIRAALGE
jgi:hypothetical protein